MVYEEFYKARRIPKLAESLAKRCQDAAAGRQEKQRDLFWAKRNQSDDTAKQKTTPLPEKKKNTRLEMLHKWKAEKMKKLEEEKKKKKPIFKVGVVQRTATGSPLINMKTNKKSLPTINKIKSLPAPSVPNTKSGIITRSKAKGICSAQGQHQKNPLKNLTTETKTPKSSAALQNKFCKIDVGVVNFLHSYEFKPPKSISRLCPQNKLTYPNSPKLTKKNKSFFTPNVKEASTEMGSTIKKSQISSRKTKMANSSFKGKIINAKRSSNLKEKSPILSEKKILNNSLELKNATSFEAEKPEKVITEPSSPAMKIEDDKEKSTPPVRNEENIYVPICYSPFVTVRSGKKAKKRSKIELSLQVEEEIKKEENEFNCRIFSFRKYIECETKRLLEACEYWRNLSETSDDLPADVEGEINAISGKTKLLTSDKFKQFQSLIDKCEEKDPLIKLDDLQGFQDWISIDVERIDGDLVRLEKRKNNNWVPETIGKDNVKQPKARMNKAPRSKPAPKSNVRSHIKAFREKLKKEKENDEMENGTPKVKVSNGPLRDVLNSGAKRNSGLEILAASQKSKFYSPATNSTVTIADENAVVAFNQWETPGKSILRKSPPQHGTRSKNRVTFKKTPGSNDRSGKKKTLGLDEKYFRPAADADESPLRLVFGNLNLNSTPQMFTRSRAKSMNIST